MNFVPKKAILLYSDEAIEHAKENINLGRPSDLENLVEMIKRWIEKQAHFKRKNFSTNYIQMMIFGGKGSTERVKKQLDKMCTFRTLMPQYFQPVDVKSDYKEVFEIASTVVLPNYSKDLQRIFIMKFWGDVKKSSQLSNLHKYSFLIVEYLMQVDTVSGFYICIDLSNTNIFEIVTKQNPFELKDIAAICMDAYGMRIKGIFCITQSKLIDAFLGLIKPVLKPKIISRIHVYKDWNELYDVLGKDVLPKEFGGNERSIMELQEDWLDELSEDDFKRFIKERTYMCTDESLRPKAKFNEEYAGTAGSFRMLSLD